MSPHAHRYMAVFRFAKRYSKREDLSSKHVTQYLLQLPLRFGICIVDAGWCSELFFE
jgi:hypothetical protein